MPSYSNGYIPDSLLITFNVGVSAGEGEWKHQLSAGTYAKHLALVALARKNTGRTLQISAGWGAYRPMHAQIYARKVHGRGAADPGKSSHGGLWEGQQTLAADYGNWSYVYNGDRAAFYRDVRAVGLIPGLISVERGYPDEPWHVIDKQPWAAAGGNTGGGQPSGGTTSPSKEWDEMASKAEIKSALFEVMSERPDAVVIHSSFEGRNGIYLVAPGYWHQFTEEQWKQFKDHGMYSAIRELVPVNARDFDVFKEIYTLNQGMVSSVTDAQIAAITKSVQDSLKNLSVDADVDDATVQKIANAAVDRLVARAAN